MPADVTPSDDFELANSDFNKNKLLNSKFIGYDQQKLLIQSKTKIQILEYLFEQAYHAYSNQIPYLNIYYSGAAWPNSGNWLSSDHQSISLLEVLTFVELSGFKDQLTIFSDAPHSG